MVYTIYILYGVCDMSAAIEQLVPTSPNDHRLHLTETDILPLVVLRGCILQLKGMFFLHPLLIADVQRVRASTPSSAGGQRTSSTCSSPRSGTKLQSSI